MAQVTGLTAVRLEDLVNDQVVNGEISDSGRLLLHTRGGAVIDAGAVTGSGGGSGGITLEFTFNTPMITWTINHGLGSMRVRVTTYGTDGVELIGDVVNTNENTTQISWAFPVAGSAVIEL